MIFAIINAILYLCLILWYWRRYKIIDEVFLMLSLWALVALLGPFLVVTEQWKWKLMMWPYIYLFVTFLVFSFYFLKRKKHLFSVGKFINSHSAILDGINIVYIACAIYELLNINLAVLSFSFLSEEAQELYLAAHEETVLIKNTLFYCQRYTSTFFVLTAISVFNYLAQGRKTLGWLLFAFTLISVIAGNAEIASRGVMFSQMLIFVSVFLVYRPYLSKKDIKSIGIGALIAGFMIAAFFIAVTIARFSDNATTGYNSPLESVIEYFGHSMLYFNYGICDVDFDTWGGYRTFHYFSKTLFGIDYHNHPDLGTHYGTAFVTFIGMLIQDFGYFGTLVLGLIVSFSMYKLWSGKNALSFSGLYIYLFYLNRMIMGVFVTPPGSDYAYAWAIITYFFLRFILKPSKGDKTIMVA